METTDSADAKTLKKAMRQKRYVENAETRKTSSKHVAAFVLGIISILGQLFWYIAYPCGILAIVLGAKSVKKTGSKLGKAGLILGIIGLAIATFFYGLFIIVTVVDSF